MSLLRNMGFIGKWPRKNTRNSTWHRQAVYALVFVFLSAGEESLTALMARAGQRANAGQEIRLADIEADAGCNMGIFEKLHHHVIQKRLKIAGSWWLEENAEIMLAIRVNRANNAWNKYWETKAA